MAEEASEKVSGVYERGVLSSKGLRGTDVRRPVFFTSASEAKLTRLPEETSDSLDAVRDSLPGCGVAFVLSRLEEEEDCRKRVLGLFGLGMRRGKTVRYVQKRPAT